MIQSHDFERPSSSSSQPGLASPSSLIYVRAPHASLMASAAAAGCRHLVTPPLAFCRNWKEAPNSTAEFKSMPLPASWL